VGGNFPVALRLVAGLQPSGVPSPVFIHISESGPFSSKNLEPSPSPLWGSLEIGCRRSECKLTHAFYPRLQS